MRPSLKVHVYTIHKAFMVHANAKSSHKLSANHGDVVKSAQGTHVFGIANTLRTWQCLVNNWNAEALAIATTFYMR